MALIQQSAANISHVDMTSSHSFCRCVGCIHDENSTSQRCSRGRRSADCGEHSELMLKKALACLKPSGDATCWSRFWAVPRLDVLSRGLEKRAAGLLLVCGDILPLIQKVFAVWKQLVESHVLNQGLNRGWGGPVVSWPGINHMSHYHHRCSGVKPLQETASQRRFDVLCVQRCSSADVGWIERLFLSLRLLISLKQSDLRPQDEIFLNCSL